MAWLDVLDDVDTMRVIAPSWCLNKGNRDSSVRRAGSVRGVRVASQRCVAAPQMCGSCDLTLHILSGRYTDIHLNRLTIGGIHVA